MKNRTVPLFPTSSPDPLDRWILWALGALALAVYAPALGAGFLFDDHHLVVENAYLHDPRLLWRFFVQPLSSTEVSSGMYRPLTMATYVANYALHRLQPFGYHLLNLLLHVVNGTLVYRLLRLMLPSVAAASAAVVAALFVIHPAHVNAVAYVAARSTLLATTGVLVSLWAYRRSALPAQHGRAWYLLAVAAFIGALGAKEIGIVTPALIVLADLTVWSSSTDQRELVRSTWRRWLPLLLVGAAYLWWRHLLTGAIGPTEPVRPGWFNLGASCLAVWHYLWFLVAPDGLCLARVVTAPTRAADPAALAAMAGYAGLLLLVVWWLRRQPVAACALGWFLIALFPSHPMGSLFLTAADHHVYLPSLGLCIAVAVFLDAGWRRWRRRMVWLLAVLLTGYGAVTWHRSVCWGDEVCVWASTVRHAPHSIFAWNNLGQAYEARGRLDDAERALLTALRLGGNDRGAIIGNLGHLFAARGLHATALPLWHLAVTYSPRTPLLLNGWALSLSRLGRHDEAAAIYQRAIDANPAIVEAYNNWGVDLALQGRLQEAIVVFRRGLPWDDGRTHLRRNLAQALAAAGAPSAAQDARP